MIRVFRCTATTSDEGTNLSLTAATDIVDHLYQNTAQARRRFCGAERQLMTFSRDSQAVTFTRFATPAPANHGLLDYSARSFNSTNHVLVLGQSSSFEQLIASALWRTSGEHTQPSLVSNVVRTNKCTARESASGLISFTKESIMTSEVPLLHSISCLLRTTLQNRRGLRYP